MRTDNRKSLLQPTLSSKRPSPGAFGMSTLVGPQHNWRVSILAYPLTMAIVNPKHKTERQNYS